MEKNDLFDLIMKAIAIYLFILAVILIPSVVKSVIWIFLYCSSILSIILGYATAGQIMSVVDMINSNPITNIFIFIFYIFIGSDLMRKGYIIKFVLEKGTTQQSSSSGQQGHSGFEESRDIEQPK